MNFMDSLRKFGEMSLEWLKNLKEMGSNARVHAGKLNRMPHP